MTQLNDCHLADRRILHQGPPGIAIVTDTWVNRQSRSLHRPQYPSRRNGEFFECDAFSELLMAKHRHVEALPIEGMGVGGRGDGTPVKRR